MPTPACDRFDDYLLGELPPAEAIRFEAHLAGCPDCRDELRRQRQLDRLLAEAATRFGPVPGSLTRQIETQCAGVRRRRTVRWACGLAATLMAATVFAWWAARDRGPSGIDRPIADQPVQPLRQPSPFPTRPSPLLAEASPARAVATVTFDDDSPAIAVPVETESPNVSIFRVYPTVTSAATPREPGARWIPSTPERRMSDELAEKHDDSFGVRGLRGDGPGWWMLAIGPGGRRGG